MANRYWVGTTGNWADASNWSTTEGGSGGATVPTINDIVYLDTPAVVYVIIDLTLPVSTSVSAAVTVLEKQHLTTGVTATTRAVLAQDMFSAAIVFNHITARGYCGALCSFQLEPIAASARTGLFSNNIFPLLETLNQFKTGAIGTGAIDLFLLTTAATTGAFCNPVLPSLLSTSELAYTIVGSIVLPCATVLSVGGATVEVTLTTLTTTGNIVVGEVINGSITIPSLLMQANVLTGFLFASSVTLPLLVISSSVEAGQVVFSSVGFPCPQLVGTLVLVPEVSTSIVLPVLRINSKLHVPHTYPAQSYTFVVQLFD
jgi:hypothetical protein